MLAGVVILVALAAVLCGTALWLLRRLEPVPVEDPAVWDEPTSAARTGEWRHNVRKIRD